MFFFFYHYGREYYAGHLHAYLQTWSCWFFLCQFGDPIFLLPPSETNFSLLELLLIQQSTRKLLTKCELSGLSFTPEERVSKNLTGLVPHVMESLQTQCERAMKMIHTRQTNIDKYLYLSSLKSQNMDLFYRLLIDHVKDLMPLVYTPTIGDVCLQYSTLYTRPEALYISIKQRKSIRTMLRNWPYPNPEICVVTDGSRILGLGDLGVNGVGISVSHDFFVFFFFFFFNKNEEFPEPKK
jgi:hypothetical protein